LYVLPFVLWATRLLSLHVNKLLLLHYNHYRLSSVVVVVVAAAAAAAAVAVAVAVVGGWQTIF
jgi:hypothetical protein